MTDPYLSIVVLGRNDNRLPMMQASAFGMITQLERYKIPSEFILVDWNTPVGQDNLSDAMSWPSNLRYCSVYTVEVSPEIHHRFKLSDKMPLYSWITLNVGIRRAKGKFILETALDTFFSNELMEFFGRRELAARALYRIDRREVNAGLPLDASLGEQLEYCRKNVHSVRTWNKKYPIHTAACGDFILLSRDVWYNIRGGPEFQLYGIYLDGLLCYIAVYYEKLKQIVLKDPMRMYHIDHDRTWRWVEKVGLEREGISYLPKEKYYKWMGAIIRGKRPVDTNGENWGLGNEELPIKCVSC